MSKTYSKLESIVLKLSKGNPSLYSKAIANAIAEGGLPLVQKTSVSPNPNEYSSPDSFRLDYLLYCYASKFEGIGDKDRLESEAISSFLRTEHELMEVNRNLESGSTKNGVEGILSDARRKIIQILGSLDNSDPHVEFNLDEMIQGCDMGPGATATLKGVDATLDKKINEPLLSVTPQALKYAEAYLRYDTTWMSSRLGAEVLGPFSLLRCSFQVQNFDRFTTVAKNWKTRRPICIQPTFNIFLQKGVGKMIRRRLRRDGIDLDDQSRNQKLAQRAFSEGYATIDLAKASDTVSFGIVRQLIPNAWFKILTDLRTTHCKIGDYEHELQKFSAMGNGFTFELESLIFYALLFAIVRCESNDWESEIAVYGDDLIVKAKYYERVCQVLDYCGFHVNDDKSFHEGNFFESCGKHYFRGVDVTPVYQKKPIDSLPEVIKAANRLFRWALDADSLTLDSRVRNAWLELEALAESFVLKYPRKKQRFVPRMPWYLEGDDALYHTDTFSWFRSHDTFVLKTVSFSPTSVCADGYALLAYTLRKGVVTDAPFNGLLSLRGRGKFRYSKRKVLFRENGVTSWA